MNERYQQMRDCALLEVVTIRPAVSEDADGVARTFLESAEHHSNLDPELYFVPTLETIANRYCEGRQHPCDASSENVSLVADLNGEIVGFIDARLFQSSDAMHRDILFCHVAEIAVSRRHQSKRIGGQLLQAAEEWGRQHGAGFSLLEYHSANARAGQFYRLRMGYRVTSITAIKKL